MGWDSRRSLSVRRVFRTVKSAPPFVQQPYFLSPSEAMRLTSRFLPAAFALAIALPAAASAQTSVSYIGAYQATLGGLSIGPVTMQLTGLTSTFDVFCIDRDNGIDHGAVYNARILTLSEAVSSTSSFTGTTNLAALQRALGSYAFSNLSTNTQTTLSSAGTEYFKRLQATASLVNQFGPAPTSSWDELQYAVWAMFANSLGQTPDNTPTPAGALFATALANASSTVDAWSNYRIIIDANAWNPTYNGGINQTLMTRVSSTVPEPGTYALMGVGLVGLFVASRRRNRNTLSA